MTTETRHIPGIRTRAGLNTLTDDEVVDRALLSDDYTTRRLALVAAQACDDRDRLASWADVADNNADIRNGDELADALQELLRWRNLADDSGLQAAQIGVLLDSLRDAGANTYEKLERYRARYAAMEWTLQGADLIEKAHELADKLLEKGQ